MEGKVAADRTLKHTYLCAIPVEKGSKADSTGFDAVVFDRKLMQMMESKCLGSAFCVELTGGWVARAPDRPARRQSSRVGTLEVE